MAGDTARCEGENLWSDIVNGFRKWVNSIRVSRDYDNKKIMLDYYARYITFNYTTFLESKYGIEREQILYIHGRQASKKEMPIIGHSGEDTFDAWYKHNKHYHKYYKNNSFSKLPENQMLTEGIEEYYSLSEKPTREIISKNNVFFNDLYDIEHIYVLGHSLADVDIPYFQRVIIANDYPNDIKWHFSYFGDKDIDRISSLAKKLGIAERQISTFNMNDMLLPHNKRRTL